MFKLFIKLMAYVGTLSLATQIKIVTFFSKTLLLLHSVFSLKNINMIESNLSLFLKLKGKEFFITREKVLFHSLYTFVESAKLWFLVNKGFRFNYTLKNQSIIDQHKGKGVIFVSFHTNCFEIGAYILNKKYDVTLTYKQHPKKHIDREIYKKRAGVMSRLIPSKKIRTLIYDLNNKKRIWIAPDQGKQSVNLKITKLFDQEIKTLSIVPKLASITNAEVIVMICGRNPKIISNIEIEFHHIPSAELNEAKITNFLQLQISKYPEQYVWNYNLLK